MPHKERRNLMPCKSIGITYPQHFTFNMLTAGPDPSNLKSISLSRAGAEPAVNVLRHFVPIQFTHGTFLVFR